MKHVLLIFMLLFGAVIGTHAQSSTGIIKGAITTSDAQPAEYVTVQLSGKTKAAITDEKGNYTLTNIARGSYTLTATLVGHQPIIENVVVESGATAIVNFQLKTSQQELSEVLVSTNRKSYIAAKASTSLRLNAELIEIPQNITVATKQTLNDMGLLTKSEIFRISSSITKSYGEELDLTFQIRGMDATYGTYRNGVGGPIWWNAQEDGAMIERMEFVKGPAGFMLANAEPGGLINVVTKQPTRQRITEIGFGVGSWNMMRTHVDLGGEFKKAGKFTYRLNAGLQKRNEYYQFGEFYRYWVCPVLKYDFSENTSLTLEHNYVKAAALANIQYGVSINGDIKALPVNLAIVDPNLDKFFGEDIYNRVHLKHKISDSWTVNVQAAHMATRWDGLTMSLETISPTKDTIQRRLYFSDWDGKLTNLQIFADGKFYTGRHAEHKILIGIDYGNGNEGSVFNGKRAQNKFPLTIKNPVYYLPKDSFKLNDKNKINRLSTNRWQALYIQDHIKLYDKFIITLAGRFTHLRTGKNYITPPNDTMYENPDPKFIPRLGFTYMFNSNVSAYILHDESFLAQRGSIFEGGRLPPLTGSNNEIGIKALLFNKQLSFTASVYDMRKKDVGTADQGHPGFYIKTGEIRSRGIDIDIAGKVNQNIYINLNYAYANPKITKNTDPLFVGIQNPGTTKNVANLWAKYYITDGVFKNLGIGAGYQFTGKRSAVWPGWNNKEGNKYLPAYSLFDAGLSYTIGMLNINFNAYNLANIRYATGGQWLVKPVSEFLFYQGRPRNFRLQTTFKL